MGCYGIGVSRILSAIVEQNNDEKGIVWPISMSPFHIHIVPVSASNETQMKAATQIYTDLAHAGFEILLDDREERPGVKFNDSDLIGIPFRIVVGKLIEDGCVEVIKRATGEKSIVPFGDILSYLSNNGLKN